jgi:perosamine synthetase
VTNNSLVPVLVDCDPHTFNCDAASIRQKITPRTKAVMVVHIYGLPVDMNPILELCRENNLFLIEDAAEVIGQTYRGKQCGSFGDISTFSFYPNKHITTGEGGMVVCDDIKIAERGKYLRNLCFKDEKRFHHDEIGYNYRMTNLQAALGVAQVPELPDIVKKKRSIGRQYYERLQNLKSCSLPVCETSYAQNIYWVFSIVIKPNSKVTREEVVNELSNKRIGTRPFFIPMHMQPVFQDMGLFKNEEYPNSEYISKNGFYVPSGLGLTTADVNDVCDALIKVLS